jgi:hypothetical protein
MLRWPYDASWLAISEGHLLGAKRVRLEQHGQVHSGKDLQVHALTHHQRLLAGRPSEQVGEDDDTLPVIHAGHRLLHLRPELLHGSPWLDVAGCHRGKLSHDLLRGGDQLLRQTPV